eukprot:4891244-Pleurochrysis_carterae.AAC.2
MLVRLASEAAAQLSSAVSFTSRRKRQTCAETPPRLWTCGGRSHLRRRVGNACEGGRGTCRDAVVLAT